MIFSATACSCLKIWLTESWLSCIFKARKLFGSPWSILIFASLQTIYFHNDIVTLLEHFSVFMFLGSGLDRRRVLPAQDRRDRRRQRLRRRKVDVSAVQEDIQDGILPQAALTDTHW